MVSAGIGKTVVIGLLLGSSPGCRDRAAGQPARSAALAEPAAVLWLPAEATIEPGASTPREVRDGRSLYEDGSAAVVFRAETACGELASRFMARFDGTAWRRRPTDWLNPTMPTSFDAGCERRQGGIAIPSVDGRPPGPRFYERWNGQWENDQGDILSYQFMGGDGSAMQGYASYTPAAIVKVLRSRRGR